MWKGFPPNNLFSLDRKTHRVKDLQKKVRSWTHSNNLEQLLQRMQKKMLSNAEDPAEAKSQKFLAVLVSMDK